MVGPSINICVRSAVSLVRGLLQLTTIIAVVESFEEHTVKVRIDTKHYPLVISGNNAHTHTLVKIILDRTKPHPALHNFSPRILFFQN